MVNVHLRPPEVTNRVMPGRREGDLRKGANNCSAVSVLLERRTRLPLLARMPDSTAESALAAFTAELSPTARPLRRTFTCDQGREMARHRELARASYIRLDFCDLHSPWQRGSCENANELRRQMPRKGAELSGHDSGLAELMLRLPETHRATVH